jgi:hypothetical protein
MKLNLCPCFYIQVINEKDMKLLLQVRRLQSLRDGTSIEFQNTLQLVHCLQSLLLRIIYMIRLELDEHCWSPRSYREQLPSSDRAELENTYSENMFFAAQAIRSGFRIRGIERFTSQLQDPANALCSSLEFLRLCLHQRATTSLAPPYHDLSIYFTRFEEVWVNFESQMCQCYHVLASSRRIQHTEGHLLQHLFTETIRKALESSLMDRDQVESLEPKAIYSVPRLAILDVVKRSDNPLLKMSFFTDLNDQMVTVGQSLQQLESSDYDTLQQALVHGEAECLPMTLRQLYKDICSIADTFHSSKKSRDMALLLGKTFTEYPFLE